MSGPRWSIRPATRADAAAVHEVSRAAFAGQDTLDPPSGVFGESADDVADRLDEHGGLLAVDAAGEVVGALRFREGDGRVWLRRVAVRPDVGGRGIGSSLVAAGEREAGRRGYRAVHIGVRSPLEDNIRYWRRRGYVPVADHDFWVELVRRLAYVEVPTVEDMQALGRRLSSVLRAGDLVLLSGDLGAGKTALTQGIGEGLGVRGAVTSPTFVIARVHPSLRDGPPLVHVDAYRLGTLAEVDDLDLDATLEESVTVVEWGGGIAEGLAEDRLEVVVTRATDPADDTRTVTLAATGSRWSDVDLDSLTRA